MPEALSEQLAYTITIETNDGAYWVFRGNELLGVHPTLDRAQFAAFLVAHESNLGVKKLEFEPDELGNLVALVAA